MLNPDPYPELPSLGTPIAADAEGAEDEARSADGAGSRGGHHWAPHHLPLVLGDVPHLQLHVFQGNLNHIHHRPPYCPVHDPSVYPLYFKEK